MVSSLMLDDLYIPCRDNRSSMRQSKVPAFGMTANLTSSLRNSNNNLWLIVQLTGYLLHRSVRLKSPPVSDMYFPKNTSIFWDFRRQTTVVLAYPFWASLVRAD